jgi:orotate phosphoribosyltransferase
MSLFQVGLFQLHSGGESNFRINCEELSYADLQALAHIGASMVGPFGDVIGIPTGGQRFADLMWQYRTVGPLLIVDDVMTTGRSMREAQQNDDDKGLVIFLRGYPKGLGWVTAIFEMDDNYVVADGQ